MESVTQKAFAKINLGLDVLRRRENGYHDLRMIMQTVRIYDELTIRKTENAGEIVLTTNIPGLPVDDGNLIVKAARLMMEKQLILGGLKITLNKQIPMAAGMAGGSTDAAAVFRMLNELYDCGLTKEELCAMGVKIGADVPYCIMGGTYLAEGIGEILTRLPKAPDTNLVVIKPDFDVSTKYVYENLHANELKTHPDIDGQIRAIQNGDIRKLSDLMGNVLQNVTVMKYPEIDEIKRELINYGAFGSMMSGSGPSVFGLFEEKKTAQNAAEKLREIYPDAAVYVTDFVSEDEIG